MLYTYIHHKEYSGASWDVAHLYEHLVTYSFQSYLKSLTIHPGLIGHISGDTFEHAVFLNATFYDQRVADAYEYFLTTPSLVGISSIPQVLLEIEAEEKAILVLQDKVKFEDQLQSLITEPWIDDASLESGLIDETPTAEEIFRVKRAAKEYRDTVVGIYVDTNELDSDEQTLFLRLSAIIGDVVDFTLRRELRGVYYIGSSPISQDDTIMGNMHHIRFRRNISLKQVRETAENALRTIDVKSAMPLITAQFEEFADRKTWKSVAIDYYRNTGILTNNVYIASLATPERIASIILRLKIHVRSMRRGEEGHFS